MKKLFLVVFALLIFPSFVHAACTGSNGIWTSSADETSFASCVTGASAGDTVNVSAGSFTITSKVTTTHAIHIHGNNTQITSALAPAIAFQITSCSTSPEIDGFHFISSGTSSDDTGAFVGIDGSCNKIKFHDNVMTFYNSSSRGNMYVILGPIFGVIYNNTYTATQPSQGAFLQYHYGLSQLLGYTYGDDSWSSDVNYNSNQEYTFLYVEGNTVNGNNTSGTVGFSNSGGGARTVERYNTITNAMPNSHGFDSDNNGRGRGMRIKIGYNNSITASNSDLGTCWQTRGGTSLIYNNYIGNGWNSGCVTAFTYRYTTTTPSAVPDGNNNGVSPNAGWCWPYSAGDPYAQYEGSHYICDHGYQGNQACCQGINSYYSGCVLASQCTDGASHCVGPVDDVSRDGQGPPCRDGIGQGKDSGLGTVQAPEPLFYWNNTGTSASLRTKGDVSEGSGYYTDTGGNISTAASAPSSCTSGKYYFNTTNKELYKCTSGAWEVAPYYSEYTCPHPLTGLYPTYSCNASSYGVSAYLGGNSCTDRVVTASAGSGGSISPSSRCVVNGNTTTFTVTANSGYAISAVTGTCGGSLAGTTYTTNAITGDCTVTASFSAITAGQAWVPWYHAN